MVWTAEEVLLGFARSLRAAGVPVTPDREMTFLRSAALVGMGERGGLYWAGRATLTGSRADLDPYDQVFEQWFGGTRMDAVASSPRSQHSVAHASLDDSVGNGEGDRGSEKVMRALASDREVLRQRDIAQLTPSERAVLRRQFATLRPRAPLRRARRHTRSRGGPIDGPATLRSQLRRMGEPGVIVRRRRTARPRRVVLLIDVSGSMSSYADALLRLAHTYLQSAPRSTEVFTIGTRLTHVTRALRHRDPDQALLNAGAAAADWSGGTRLGEVLGAFLDRWGRRGMARGSVVVIFSDGWERAQPQVLGEQMRQLAAVSHRVVWANPHRGRTGYAPVQSGIVAALPHVDEFVAGHSLAAFEDVLDVIAGA
ncbi:MAG: VWA domain-containing protein [Ornithinimicrobium sp.]